MGDVPSYETMLRNAMAKLPKKADEKKRFQIPEVVSFIQGNKTIVKNFSEILSTIRRDDKHFGKYLLKQLATPGTVEGGTLILARKVEREMIQRKLEDYVREFVFCKVCGEPDTVLVKDNRIESMHCEACGARSAVKGF
jgi:translation initiation factor 2 subunit 2